MHRFSNRCFAFLMVVVLIPGSVQAQGDGEVEKRAEQKKEAARLKALDARARKQKAATAAAVKKRAARLNANRKPAVDRSRQLLTTNLLTRFDRELKVFAGFLDIDKADIDKLRKSSQSRVEEFANALADEDLNGNRRLYLMPGPPPQKLIDQVIAAAEPLAKEPQIKAYRDDLQRRHEFRNRTGIESWLTVMDQQVAFDPSQVDKVEAVVKTAWKADWNSIAQRALNSNYPVTIPLPTENLETILTAEQMQALNRMKNSAQVIRTITIASRQNSEEMARRQSEQFRKEFASSVDLRIDALKRTFPLTDSQVRKLQVLGKGVAADVMRLRARALEIRKKSSRERRVAAGGNGAAEPVDFRLLQVLLTRPGALLLAQPNWAMHRDQVLTAEQKAEWRGFQSVLDDCGRRSVINNLICSMDQRMGLSGQKINEFSELCLTAVRLKPISRSYTYETNFALLDISADEYQKVLDDEQFAYVSQLLDSLIRRKEMMDAADKARKE